MLAIISIVFFIVIQTVQTFTEKNGIPTDKVVDLCKHVIDKCENLELIGLMTIGQYGFDCSQGPNPDFLVLIYLLLAINYFKR